MNNKPWKPYGSYKGMYQKFYEASQDASGYDFGQGPAEKVPPPTVKGLNSLTWWALDRPKRLAAIRRVRDQFLYEILNLRKIGEGQLHRSRRIDRLSVGDRGMTGIRKNSKKGLRNKELLDATTFE